MSDSRREIAVHSCPCCSTDKKIPLPIPAPKDMEDPLFDKIWQVIKTWDVNVPSAYCGYCGANGSHVQAIVDGIKK